MAELPKGKKLHKETPIAERILELEEQPKLFAELPGWLRLLVIFDLQTAARRGDLVHLKWKAVHQNHCEFLETKECKKRVVQLSRDARAVLDMLRPDKPAPEACVFEPALDRRQLEDRITSAWRHRHA